MTDAVLGFAAGVMLAASLFSLIIPGLEAAQRSHGRLSAGLIVTSAILMGAGLIALIERYAPHEHFVHGRQGRSSANVRRIWLFVIAITLHNIPEGLAVGIGYGSGDLRNGTILALAIGLQNVPEGLAVAAALVSVGYSRSTSVAVSLGTGLIEPIAGLFGAAAVSLFNPLLPWGMGFAAGAMLFVISHEIIPETHRKGHEALASGGFMVGFATMMMLDVSLR
jgi:ZIP family zinc transporter